MARRAAAPPDLADFPPRVWERLRKRAALLRSIGSKPLTEELAARIARALKVSQASVYRWYRRFRSARTVSSLAPRSAGFPKHQSRLIPQQEKIIIEAIRSFRRSKVPLRVTDVLKEVQQRCRAAEVAAPSRRSLDRRLQREPDIAIERRKQPTPATPKIAPGTFNVRRALEVVQIDHTQVDIMVVDEITRTNIGRPWLTVAVDVATRSILGFRLAMERPNAATVALCLVHVIEPKRAWLDALGLHIEWPMYGLPHSLHLDNAMEFHSEALERGCAQFGIELTYRPPGRPHYGGHVERFIGTLMQRLRMLPGATGPSIKGRKQRAPEASARLTLRELEQWLTTEIGVHYHQGAHRGLQGGTPMGAWRARPPLSLRELNRRELLMAFLPAEPRKVRRDGLHLNNIRYWHPIFSNLVLKRKSLLVHYDPRDMSKLYARSPSGDFLEIPYADLRHPSVSLWELRAAWRQARESGQVDERTVFAAVEKQCAIVAQAKKATHQARQPAAAKTKQPRKGVSSKPLAPASVEVDEGKLPKYEGEVWS